MRPNLTALSTLSLLLIASSRLATAQATWYVDASAAPPGNGSPSAPFSSVAIAVSDAAVVSGDTLLIAPGVYPGKVALGSKGLRLQSSGGALVTELRATANGALVESAQFGPPVELIGLSIVGAPNKSTIGVSGGNVTLRQCVVREHRASGGTLLSAGTGVFSKFDIWVEQCTVVDNLLGCSVDPFSGALYLRESIFSGHLNADVYEGLEGSISSANFCMWETGAAHSLLGAGNVAAADPSFWDPDTLDLRLAPGSVCIDAGDPLSPLDPDGSRRDIGAFAYDASYAPPATVYCTSKTNSLGCVPSIAASGAASSSSPAPFLVTCSNELNQRAGFLFYGFAPRSLAYQGGYLCVQSPTLRTAVQDSGGNMGLDDCSGVYSFDFNALIRTGTVPALVPGELIFAQYWSRDPSASFGTNRSDAVRLGIAP